MKYIALLRGVNLSGKNKIAMSDLKREFTTLGYKKVITYLNSGNVVFKNEIDDKNWFVTTLKCGLFLCTKGI